MIWPTCTMSSSPGLRICITWSGGTARGLRRLRLYQSTSTDPDGTVVAWTWTIDGHPGSGKLVSQSTPEGKPIDVTLTFTDNLGARGSAAKSCVGGQANRPPLPDTDMPNAVHTGAPLAFKVWATDPDGDATTLLPPTWTTWLTLTDGQANGTAGPVGGYPFTFRAKDIHGAEGTTQRVLVVYDDTSDLDRDGVADVADNCPTVANRDQADRDPNGKGDACEARNCGRCTNEIADPAAPLAHAGDMDADGVGDASDNCLQRANADQSDQDGDSIGDACDSDLDGDGMVNADTDANTLLDNCPTISNPDQRDTDANGVGDACQQAAVQPQASHSTNAGPVSRAVQSPSWFLVLLGVLALAVCVRRKRA